MSAIDIEHQLTIWMKDDIPARMVYAGRRWRVSDTPTRLRHSIWDSPRGGHALYGWRFQATANEGDAFVFDIYREPDGWHVHRAYD